MHVVMADEDGLGWAGLWRWRSWRRHWRWAWGCSHAVPAPGGTLATQASQRSSRYLWTRVRGGATPILPNGRQGEAPSVDELQSAARTQKTEQLLLVASVIALRQPEEGHRKSLERGASFGSGLW
ncbi:uncharacterized protein TrAtP1_005319 [Trichoderma atroviride]|uniref:uncharacterized protein n=1 Tax=Hypocrea atroviridis TaxID=63577 RepID=UPI00331B1678|nr:hypothetical protein TrAtP1_005319 [Trichoderma atroviride]